jgi:hypothetical protein
MEIGGGIPQFDGARRLRHVHGHPLARDPPGEDGPGDLPPRRAQAGDRRGDARGDGVGALVARVRPLAHLRIYSRAFPPKLRHRVPPVPIF